jgi:hypothetical protein
MPDADLTLVDAVEVVKGSSSAAGGPQGPASGFSFWTDALGGGHRLPAIAAATTTIL